MENGAVGKQKPNHKDNKKETKQSTHQKTQFKFTGTHLKGTQEEYNNLIKETTKNHKQFQTIITKLEQNKKENQKTSSTTKTVKSNKYKKK